MKPCFGRVCVWLICRDVKLRRLFVFCLCRGHAAIMQTHANEAMHDGGSRGWSPWCTCIVVTTCCSGFASIQLSMSGDGKRLNPRTSKSILFLHGCHNLYFRRNHVADVFWLFRRNHVADVFFDYSGKPSPKPCSPLTLFFVLSTCWSYQTLWNLVWTPFDNIGCSTSVLRSTTRGSTVSLMV